MVPPSNIERLELNCAGKRLALDRPRVMGVLNVTPDSFSDGGRYVQLDKAFTRAAAMVEEGADLIDIGGESTRPGARPVSLQEELDRVMPVLEKAVRELPIPISIDTSKPAVMAAAARAGAGMINDVRALQEEGALAVAAAYPVPICLMHMRGRPVDMQDDPRYDDVVADVKRFLTDRLALCEAAGIGRERLLIDPGIGFGKTLAHNLSLLRRLPEFHRLGAPLLLGVSRKSMIGKILAAPAEERLYGGLAAAVIAVWQGAHIIRSHDVKPTVQALRICAAVMQAQ